MAQWLAGLSTALNCIICHSNDINRLIFRTSYREMAYRGRLFLCLKTALQGKKYIISSSSIKPTLLIIVKKLSWLVFMFCWRQIHIKTCIDLNPVYMWHKSVCVCVKCVPHITHPETGLRETKDNRNIWCSWCCTFVQDTYKLFVSLDCLRYITVQIYVEYTVSVRLYSSVHVCVCVHLYASVLWSLSFSTSPAASKCTEISFPMYTN